MQTIDSFAPLITSIALIIDVSLIALLLLNAKKNNANIYFLITLFSMTIWHLTEFVLRITPDRELALVFGKLMNVNSPFVAVFFLLFCASFIGKELNWVCQKPPC